MKSLQHTRPRFSQDLAEKLFQLERTGRYDTAVKEMAEIWPNVLDGGPDIADCDPESAAEILLRAGAVIGFYGHSRRVPNSQDVAKDLLSQARHRFLEAGLAEKAAECENYLALTYWRTGELNEAVLWVKEALSRLLPSNSPVSLYANATKALINLSLHQHQQNINEFAVMESEFRFFGDAFLNGLFYSNLGVSYKNLDLDEQALSHLKLAKYYFAKAGHMPYLAVMENNLAMLLLKRSSFTQAHEAIDQAVELFRQTDDQTRAAYALDSKAQIYFSAAEFKKALATIDESVTTLRQSDNRTYLIEALMTRARILLNMDDFAAATLTMIEGVEEAKVQTGDKAAEKLVRDFEAAMEQRRRVKEKTQNIAAERHDDELCIVLPPELEHLTDIQGVWINNNGLEQMGLKQGDLAIVVEASIEKGDLVAIREKESGQVICGCYDYDFGIICIDCIDTEPQLFDERDVTIIGKIVAMCSGGDRDGAELLAKPL